MAQVKLWELFALFFHEEIVKTSSPKPDLSDFEIILEECSLGEPFQKLFAKF